ncbi:MAG: S8 family serine peptidase, partial [Caldilineaceae bacterium]|nr:S8 family serine peptidase [Caldilineaceae bacterium]
MRKPFAKLLTVVSACSLLLGTLPGTGQAAPARQETPPPIQLEIGTFTPGQTALPLDPDLTIGTLPAGQSTYYLIQFTGPVQGTWKAAVEGTGAQLLEYVPDYAFVVRMTREQATQVEQQANVRFVDPYQPAYKFNLALSADEVKSYTIVVHDGVDVRSVARSIIDAGITVLSRQGNVIIAVANGPQVKTIAKLPDVAWIEESLPIEPHNEFGGGVIVGADTVHANGYTGQNQVIAVADSGLDRGDKIEEFPDIPNRRIREIFNWPGIINDQCIASIVDDGTQDVDSGHGTHVAVSALGAGLAGPTGIGRGVAPAAELVFQAVQNYVIIKDACGGSAQSGYQFIGLPEDLSLLFAQARRAGAHVHNNSWGSRANGTYTFAAAQVDNYTFIDDREMTIVFSAGNEGIDRNSDGVV